jgi:signal transduction histidine kinase
MRRSFFRRMAFGAVAFFVLTFAASGVAVGALTHAFGAQGHRGVVALAAFLTLALLVIGFVAARSLRRLAAPVGDVMEAADRVAAGDYSTRVTQRGPREMRRLAASFNAMTERLGANEEQRRNLLADVAHELRTPLSVIQGTAEGMLDGLYPADRTHLEPLVDEAKVMSRLLDDLRLLSTAEAGALRLHRRTVEPAELVEEAAGAFRSPAEAAGVALEVDVEPGLPVLDADPVRIGEVLSNLVSNALRHTPAGGSVTVRAEAGDAGEVAFEVRDSGSGIPPEVLPHAFDRFVKGAGSGGAGLGLSIAKSLVQAHGGRIWAESEPGKGTRVRFVIPAGAGAGLDPA